MGLELRLLTDADIPALQGVYNARPDAFRRLIGRPALPDQAAADFVQGLTEPGRHQFGITFDTAFIGLADLKLDPEVEGKALLGLILLAPPYNDTAITALVLRILERWLSQTYRIHTVEAAALAHDSADLTFWQAQGYRFTGDHYRRDLPGYAPRFLLLRKNIADYPTAG